MHTFRTRVTSTLLLLACCLSACGGGEKKSNEYGCSLCSDAETAEETCADLGAALGCESAEIVPKNFIDGCTGTGDPISQCELRNCEEKPDEGSDCHGLEVLEE